MLCSGLLLLLCSKGAPTKTTLSCTTDDKYAWRKYGQKGIQNYKYPRYIVYRFFFMILFLYFIPKHDHLYIPFFGVFQVEYKQIILYNSVYRSYFRCSYKHDQGCNATKQVQLEQENPRMYRITYIDLHTCNDIPKVTHKTVDSSTGESSLLHSDRGSNEMDHLISSPNLAMKPEFPRETHTSSDLHDHRLLESSMWLEYWKESEPFNSTIMPLTKASDNSAENAYSCADIQNLDMDFGGVASVLLDSHFHFDEDLFF